MKGPSTRRLVRAVAMLLGTIVVVSLVSIGCKKNTSEECTQDSDCASGNICCINPQGGNICTVSEACTPTPTPTTTAPACAPYGSFVDVGEPVECGYPYHGVEWNVEVTCKARDGACVFDQTARRMFAHQLKGEPSKADFVEGNKHFQGDFCNNTFTWQQYVYLRLTDGLPSTNTFEAGTWTFVDKDHFDWDSTVTDADCNLLYRCTGHGARNGSARSAESCRDFSTSLAAKIPPELTHSRCDGSGPFFSQPHVGGKWHQSFVCTGVAGPTGPGCCERVDDDPFTLYTEMCGSDAVLSPDLFGNDSTGFKGTYSPGRVTWTGTNEKGTPTQSTESGIWTFSDANHFTSTSTYRLTADSSKTGKCVANGMRGAVPPPVASPPECDGKPLCP